MMASMYEGVSASLASWELGNVWGHLLYLYFGWRTNLNLKSEKMIPLSIIRQWGYDFNRRTIGTPYHIWISPYYIWSKMIRIWKVIEWKAIPVFMEIVKIRWFYIRSNFPKGNCRQKISSSTGEDWRTFVRQQLCKSVALLRTRWMSLENKIILSVTKS